MTGEELLRLFEQAYCRTHVVGTKEDGVIVALDLEGRFFTVVNNQVISKVNPQAIQLRSNKETFQNPGGDALWPAPEGTRLGYEYSTGNWRVPPSITGAVWEVVSRSGNQCVTRAEIDLINNIQEGIPCEFERHVSIEKKGSVLIQKVKEMIRYIGERTLNRTKFSLAPWSLCQFNSSDSGNVYMPMPPGKEDIWDMYNPSDQQRGIRGDLYAVNTETPERFQLALSEKIPWIQYVNANNYRVKRYSEPLPEGQHYIDIADSPPWEEPSGRGVSLSIYCDPSGFLELEACGGCPEKLEPGIELFVNVTTECEVYQ